MYVEDYMNEIFVCLFVMLMQMWEDFWQVVKVLMECGVMCIILIGFGIFYYGVLIVCLFMQQWCGLFVDVYWFFLLDDLVLIFSDKVLVIGIFQGGGSFFIFVVMECVWVVGYFIVFMVGEVLVVIDWVVDLVLIVFCGEEWVGVKIKGYYCIIFNLMLLGFVVVSCQWCLSDEECKVLFVCMDIMFNYLFMFIEVLQVWVFNYV